MCIMALWLNYPNVPMSPFLGWLLEVGPDPGPSSADFLHYQSLAEDHPK